MLHLLRHVGSFEHAQWTSFMTQLACHRGIIEISFFVLLSFNLTALMNRHRKIEIEMEKGRERDSWR